MLTLSGDLESLKIATDAHRAIIVINKCDSARAELEPLLEDTRRQIDTFFKGESPPIVQISCRDAANARGDSTLRLSESPTAVSL